MISWVHVTATIGASLDTVTTTDAVTLVDQVNTIRSLKCSTYGANLCTGRFVTVVAHFRHKKCFEDLFVRDRLLESTNASIGRFDLHTPIILHGVLLNPGSEIEGLRGNRVLLFTGGSTSAASDTLLNVDTNAVPGSGALGFFRCIYNAIKGFD
jgi:hypothetical protein